MSTATINRPLNVRRIGVITLQTFTQLVRMKVFYFLVFFAVILLASNLFNIQTLGRADLTGLDTLRNIRSWSLGTMTLFSVVLAVVATALLLPRDVEDRTLYTILAKPVPRLDYLLGKLFGVLLLIFVSLLFMDVLMTGVLHVRTQMVIAEQVKEMTQEGWSADQLDELRQTGMRSGATWGLQGAVLLVFLRSAVIAASALLFSTISTSTLFTTITGFLFYFIGNFQEDVRSYYMSTVHGSVITKAVSWFFAALFPNYQLYNVVDAVIEGRALALGTLGMLIGVSAFYVLLYSFVSWLVFAKKEF
jgi:ABC-2 family transporter protein